MPETSSTPLSRLVRRLDVERLDRDLFLGDPGRGRGRLFGGMVAAQSLVAAARTVDEGEVHSLHAYFIRPGQHGVPIQFVVHRIRDGRTFTTRRVVAHQGGEGIFSLEASFARAEEGISHQPPMPAAPGPEGLGEWDLVRPDTTEDHIRRVEASAIEIRACDEGGVFHGADGQPMRRVWTRPRAALPEDPVLHAAMLTYASDRGMLSTVGAMHGIASARRQAASLDHTIWFHRPPRWEGWVFYTTASPAAHNARALMFGNMYREDGTLMATIAQEGLVRTAAERR
ncbi:MAG: acyl-CoA thioesterase [Dehalococcoidia bacterium]